MRSDMRRSSVAALPLVTQDSKPWWDPPTEIEKGAQLFSETKADRIRARRWCRASLRWELAAVSE